MVFVLSILTFAILTPTQLTPLSGSIVTSSTLTWQAVEGAKDYRVIVDNEPTATGNYVATIYKTNTNYSPQLNPGTYYWKVEARDNNNQWSTWSPVWGFTLSTSQPSPSPSPSPSIAPSPSPSPSPSASPTSSFLVSGVPQALDSTDSFSASVTITNLVASSQYYLKGAFVTAGSSNYFGKTQVSDSWIKNSQTFSSQLPITTDSSGSWSGNVTVMPDEEDSGFSAVGNYLFKIGHYTNTGSGLTWSNESLITINQVSQGISLSSESSLETQDSNPTPTPSSTPIVKTVNGGSNEQTPETINTKVRLPDLSSDSAKIAGIATEAATPSALPTNFKKGSYFNFPLILGGVLIGGSFAAMLVLKRVGKI